MIEEDAEEAKMTNSNKAGGSEKEDGQTSIYSGNSGLGSLVSQSIDYFNAGGGKTEDDDDNASHRLSEVSGESGDSDDTNSL